MSWWYSGKEGSLEIERLVVQFQVSGTLHEKEKGELWGGEWMGIAGGGGRREDWMGITGGGVEERTGWEGEDKRTKWSERGKEEKRGAEGRANFLLFFLVCTILFRPPQKTRPLFFKLHPINKSPF